MYPPPLLKRSSSSMGMRLTRPIPKGNRFLSADCKLAFILRLRVPIGKHQRGSTILMSSHLIKNIRTAFSLGFVNKPKGVY